MLEVTIQVSEASEGTESPWWVIIDPRQMMTPDVDAVANMITGPFFSREEAEAHLKARTHAFGPKAVVYCHTGYWSQQYKEACRKSEREGR